MFTINLTESAALTLLELVEAQLDAARVELARASQSNDNLGAALAADRVEHLNEAMAALQPVADLLED